MIRTQILLTPRQAAGLRELAAREGRSMADLVRDAVDGLLQARAGVGRDEIKRRSLAALGRYRSGTRNLGSDHDRHLGEALDR